MSYHRRLIALIILVVLPLGNALFAQATDRITAVVDDRQTVTRPGNRYPLARAEFDAGIAAPDYPLNRMLLVLDPAPAQKWALEGLLQSQQNPQSPEYHQWLTPEQFGERFGVSDHDVKQVVSWLERHGFQVEPVSAARGEIIFSGTAAQVEDAFHTQIHRYNVNGQMHYANATDPRIPVALAAVVNGVASLHDFRANPMHAGIQAAPAPEYSNGSTHYMAPADFATIYDVAALYSGSLNGAGQSIAVLGRSNFPAADVTTFRSNFGLAPNSPTVVLNGPNPGIVSSSEQTEAELDVEWSGAVATGAAVKFILSGSTSSTDGILLSAQYAVNQNVAPVISLSFGLCEAAMGTSQNQAWNSLWQQAAAQGTSVLVASGDNGAAGCDSPSAATAVSGAAVNGLCSSPYSTCVGGTQFSDTASPSLYWAATTNPSNWGSALSYIPEAAWNASGTVGGGSDLWATGGGSSKIYTKPTWQAGTGVPADGRRDVPDVSVTASSHDGYLFVMNGSVYLVGGTSASTPAFAGFIALAAARAGARQGNANPILYGLAQNQSNGGAAVFHDVTVGNNSVPGVLGYSAGSGYDLATGLGSVDAFQLVNHWSDASTPAPSAPGFQVTPAASTLVVAPGSSSTLGMSVSIHGGFNAPLTLSAGTLPAGLSASFLPPSIPAPGSGASTLTVTASATVKPGAYSLQVAANGGGISQFITLPVTVQSQCTYSINPTSATAAAAGGNFSATISAGSGCAWTAASTVNWITVLSGASGSGNGVITYSVAANSSTTARSGALSVAGLTLPVTQSAAASVPPLNPVSATFTAAGGRSSIAVALAPPNSSWTAKSSVSWITITSGASSSGGNTTVNYSVAQNTGTTRTGNITIANLVFVVTQAGPSCTYGISLGKMTSVSGGVDATAAISTQSACPWSAASNVSWISVLSGSPGSGSGTLAFFIATNPNSSVRTGVLSVAGYSIQVTEGAAGAVQMGKPIK